VNWMQSPTTTAESATRDPSAPDRGPSLFGGETWLAPARWEQAPTNSNNRSRARLTSGRAVAGGASVEGVGGIAVLAPVVVGVVHPDPAAKAG